jgi:malonyl-CoA O-methyltransferase
MNKQLHLLEKSRIRASFDAAAEYYDDVAVLQREIVERILERLDLVKLQPATILDIGAGTGVAAYELSKRYKKSRVIAFDLALNMLKQARQRGSLLSKFSNKRTFVCGDAEQLPFVDNSVELIFSSSTLQWCSDLDHTFAELKRILKPGGLLMFSTFGPDTLKELRQSWQAADVNTAESIHVHDFIDMHDIGDAMLRADFDDPVMDVENFTLTYADAYQLMRELKTLGAHNVASDRRHTLTGKSRVKNMVAAYETLRCDGSLPATYEVVYGHAWAPLTKTNEVAVGIPVNPMNPGVRR